MRIFFYQAGAKISGIRPERSARALTAQTETANQAMIRFDVAAFQIIEHTSALRDHLEQAAPRMIIFLVGSEMVGQFVDAPREQCDLHLRRSGIALMGAILAQYFFLRLFG